jgi:O-antigen/teichoic acid export membrane protein
VPSAVPGTLPASPLAPAPNGHPRSRVPTARQFVRSVFSFLIGQGLSWIGSAAMVVLLPHYLGDANLGRLGFALAISSFASFGANLGTSWYLTKEIARSSDRAPQLVGLGLATRLPLSVLSAALTVAFVNLAHYDSTTRAIVYVLCCWILVDAVRAIAQAALQGMHKMGSLAAFPAVANTLYAAGAAVFLLAGAGPLPVAVAYLAGQTVAVALTLVVLLRTVRPRLIASGSEWWMLIASGLPFFIWQASLLVYGQIDTILLSLLTNDAVVGWYYAAYRFIGIPAFVPIILMTVAFPALTAARGTRAFNVMARRTMDATLLLTIPMSLGVILVADRLIHLLHYPPAFYHSVLPIALLAAGFPMVAADMIIGTLLNTLDRQRQWAMVGVAAAVFNPLTNLLAIPLTQSYFGNGAIGAAAVTTATEILVMTVGLRLLSRGVFDSSTLRHLGRVLAAAAVMTAVVLPIRTFPIAIPVLAGALSYCVAALLLRAVSLSEVRELLRFVASRRKSTETVASADIP